MNQEQGPGEEEVNFKAPETGFEPRPGEEDLTQEEATSRAEAMARAGDKAERGAARERQLASGQAKETTSEAIKRNLKVRPFGIGSPILGGEEAAVYPEKYHESEAERLNEKADKKEEDAGEKWEKRNKK